MQKTEETVCKKCKGELILSKGIVNYHYLDRSGPGEFVTKLLDCLKCSSCGHSFVPQESTFKAARNWWKAFCLRCELDDTHNLIDNMILRELKYQKKYTELSLLEIVFLWLKTSDMYTKKEEAIATYEIKSNFLEEDCSQCKQTKQNCECHIPLQEKHKGLYQLTKCLLGKRFTSPNPELISAYFDKFSKKDLENIVKPILEQKLNS